MGVFATTRGETGPIGASECRLSGSRLDVPIDFSMISIELYGVPRLRAGTGLLHLEASTVGQALDELGRVCPALESSVLRADLLHAVYKLSLNGERFVSDPRDATCRRRRFALALG